MAEVRTCVCSLVLLVLFQRTFASPTFGSSLLSSLFCDYDDDSMGLGDYISSLLFGDDDSSEETSIPETSSPNIPAGGKPSEISLVIPPANGLNLTLQNSGLSYVFSLIPWVGGGASVTPPTPTTAAAATTPANATAANATAA